MKAPYIVIDGLDGCGKGTQLKLLEERALRERETFVLTREPGGAPLSEALRDLFKSDLGEEASALTQFLMMWASRRNYLEQVVWPALEDNIPVFSDRGDSSTLAYQVYGKQKPKLEAHFWNHRNLVFDGCLPSLYILLDVSPSVARDRALVRGGASSFDAQPVEFYERVYKGFHEFSKHPSVKMVSVNGAREPELVHEDMYQLVSSACGW